MFPIVILKMFPKFLIGSQCIPNSTTLYPITFAQSSPLAKYIGSPKEKTTICIFWECPKFDYIFLLMSQSKRLITQKK
jgi:hypothetical protein